ncbi:hypothetical protein ASZ90_007516 [hydrocarbon metagenome]|uniref:Uncharacterized protein n=1 Tax=hydrocarbon metagenome TaxID=938273 RepID=A0A0W8FP70_9ZZZZ
MTFHLSLFTFYTGITRQELRRMPDRRNDMYHEIPFTIHFSRFLES